MAVVRTFGLVSLLGCLAVAGCENAEEKARYVKAPLDGVTATDRASLNQAVSEARTRLVSVRSDRLRADLAQDIDATYERALAEAREAERIEAERKAADLEKERQAARERAARVLEEQERKRAAERKKITRTAARHERDPEADHAERRRAAVAAQRRRAKEAVIDLEVGIRASALGDGTKVLVMRNAREYPVDFSVRCHTADDGFQKTFAMTVPAKGERHLGFVQGWCGNFKGGERCEAYVDGDRMWAYTVP